MALCNTNAHWVVFLFAALSISASSARAQTASTAWVVGGGSGDAWLQTAEHWIALDDSTTPGSLQPRQIPRGHSVTREVVRSGIATTQRNLFGYRWSLHKGPRQIEADTLKVGWHPACG